MDPASVVALGWLAADCLCVCVHLMERDACDPSKRSRLKEHKHVLGIDRPSAKVVVVILVRWLMAAPRQRMNTWTNYVRGCDTVLFMLLAQLAYAAHLATTAAADRALEVRLMMSCPACQRCPPRC